MKNAVGVTLAVFRATGLVQLVVGVLFWTGHALNLIPFHMLTGSLFVLALWTLAVLGARRGVPAGPAILAVAWGLLLPALGMAQMGLLPGEWHWVIRSLHLLTGLVAMGIGERLAARAGVAPARSRQRPPAMVGWPEQGGL